MYGYLVSVLCINMLIYKIQNKINGLCYIGQTIGPLKKRIAGHLSWGGCVRIYRSIKKYGIENFDISIIDETATTREELSELEKKYILEYNSLSPNGYNLTSGGNNRFIVSEESRKKISLSQKGIPETEKTKKILSDAHKGKIFSKERCQRMSEARKGRRFLSLEQIKINADKMRGTHPTAETLKKLSESHMGQVPWNKGVPWSPEVKKKMSEVAKGRVYSEETNIKRGLAIKKQWETRKIRTCSEETRKKLSDSHKGYVFSEETLLKISNNSKKMWESEEYRQKQTISRKEGWVRRKQKIEENSK